MARRGHHEFSNEAVPIIEEYLLRSSLAKIGIVTGTASNMSYQHLLNLASVGTALNEENNG